MPESKKDAIEITRPLRRRIQHELAEACSIQTGAASEFLSGLDDDQMQAMAELATADPPDRRKMKQLYQRVHIDRVTAARREKIKKQKAAQQSKPKPSAKSKSKPKPSAKSKSKPKPSAKSKSKTAEPDN